jgi:hypothetical protein
MTITLPLPLPRDWLRLVETALTRENYPAVAEALHSARPQPRDPDEARALLPDDVRITFQEVPDGQGAD